MIKINLSRDRERIERIATQETVKKMALEPRLQRDMRVAFKSMVGDFQRTYAEHGQTIVPDHYMEDVTGILRAHYRRVSNVFAASAANEIIRTKKPSTGKSEKAKSPSNSQRPVYAEFPIAGAARPAAAIKDSVKKTMGQYTLEHSKKQARIIIDTTSKQLSASVNKIITNSLQTGVHVDSKQVAKLVSDDYLGRINGRAKVVAITETQNIAEKTKNTELQEIDRTGILDHNNLEDVGIDVDDDEDELPSLTRVWVAILDDKTREWHAEADGQEVGVSEPFIVDGEELMYPGDENGSDENICNCRCVAVPIADY